MLMVRTIQHTKNDPPAQYLNTKHVFDASTFFGGGAAAMYELSLTSPFGRNPVRKDIFCGILGGPYRKVLEFTRPIFDVSL